MFQEADLCLLEAREEKLTTLEKVLVREMRRLFDCIDSQEREILNLQHRVDLLTHGQGE